MDNEREFISDQDRYIFLLLERDRLKKEADQIYIAYKLAFGKLMTEIFELKIECIKKKKTIAFYQLAQNKDGSVNVSELNDKIEREMRGYMSALAKMQSENKSLQKWEPVSEYDVRRAKEIYKRLAKRLHPDLNPDIADDFELKTLWAEIVKAYKSNNVSALSELEILVKKRLSDIGASEDTDYEIDNIEEKISHLEDEICEITSNEPYTYGKILDDPKEKKAKTDKLQAELESFRKYSDELDKVIDDMLKNGGITLIWMK